MINFALKHPIVTGSLVGLGVWYMANQLQPAPEPEPLTIVIDRSITEPEPLTIVIQPLAQTERPAEQTASDQVKFDYTSPNYRRELELLSQALFHEARGDDYTKVLAVILNRVQSPHFPNTISGVITQPKHFSYLDEPRAVRIKRESREADKLEEIRQWTHQQLKQGWYTDTTQGALYYYAHNRMNPPYWWDHKYTTVATQGHTFASWHRVK